MFKTTKCIIQSNQLRSVFKLFSTSSASESIVLLERPAPGIAHIILNRHEGKNSLCRALVNDVRYFLIMIILIFHI